MSINTTPSSGITTIADDGTTSPLDLINLYVKPLSVLISKNILYRTAQGKVDISAGTASYFVAQRNKTRNYDGTKTPNKVHTRRYDFFINKEKDLSITFETNDWLRMGGTFVDGGAQIGESIMTNILSARQISVVAYLACELISARARIVNGKASQNFELKVLDADGNLKVTSGQTFNNFLNQRVLLVISLEIAKLEGLVNVNYVGLDRTDFYLEVSPKLYALMSQGLVVSGSDIGAKLLQDFDFTMIAGMKVYKNALLGSNHTTEIDDNETYDFSQIDIQIYHREAVAFPVVPSVNYFALDPNTANPNFINKFIVAGTIPNSSPVANQILAVRPKLVLQGKLSLNPDTLLEVKKVK